MTVEATSLGVALLQLVYLLIFTKNVLRYRNICESQV